MTENNYKSYYPWIGSILAAYNFIKLQTQPKTVIDKIIIAKQKGNETSESNILNPIQISAIKDIKAKINEK